MEVKVALPKGRLLRKTAAILQKAEWELDEYHSKMGYYRPKSQRFPDLRLRVFHEKDIPIQVAMGNYDIGICGSDWIEELLVKYPQSGLIKLKDLGYGTGALYLSRSSFCPQPQKTKGMRIASEYPNLAEAFAITNRLSHFSIIPLWGSAEAYPPENAELVLIPAKTEAEINAFGLMPVMQTFSYSAFLIVNRNSWETKNLGEVVASIKGEITGTGKKDEFKAEAVLPDAYAAAHSLEFTKQNNVRMVLPDGHQQLHMGAFLNKGGIFLDDYPSETGNRRPKVKMAGVYAKVIRPQDMPLQVANGNFDLAITGLDWLREHLNQFPASPVKKLLDLGLGKVRLVAVVSHGIAVENMSDLRKLAEEKDQPIRIASEYVNIADSYARDNHIGHYRVIPTLGASEAFLPEDADLLIENTETGRTIARHNLKIIDTIFESTACLIGNTDIKYSPEKNMIIESIIEKLKAALEVAD